MGSQRDNKVKARFRMLRFAQLVVDCRAGGRGVKDRTNTQVLKITEK